MGLPFSYSSNHTPAVCSLRNTLQRLFKLSKGMLPTCLQKHQVFTRTDVHSYDGVCNKLHYNIEFSGNTNVQKQLFGSKISFRRCKEKACHF